MNLKEAIEKIQLLFKANGVEPLVEQKFESAKLNDGLTVVEWEGDLVVGTIVNVVDENGKLPLPMGMYVLEDGTTFEIVDDMGTADKIVKAEEPSEEGAPAPAKDAPVEQAAANPTAAPKRVIKSQVEEHVFKMEIEGYEAIEVDFSPMFKKLEAENTELKKELETAKEINKEMFAIVQKIADEPISAPTEGAATKKKFSVSEFRKAFKEDLQNIKKINN